MEAFNKVPCPVLVSDQNGIILSCNEALLTLVGREKLQCVGQAMQGLFTVPSRVFLQTHVWPMVLHDGHVDELKLEVFDARAARTPVLANCRRVNSGQDHFYYWALFVSRERSKFEAQLLEARNRAEAQTQALAERERALSALSCELLATQEKVRLATESGGIGIWDLNLVTGALEWDAQSYRLYGLEPSTEPSTSELWSRCLHIEDLAAAQADFQRCLANGTDFFSEFRVMWPDGSVHYLRGFGRLHKDESGQVIRIVGTNMDITAEHQHAQSLKDARDQAEAASQSKGQFLANMSHEIRTPMNAILGMLSLLQSTELSTRQRDYTSKTEGAAKSLLGLLNDILDFSKVDAGKMELEREPLVFERMLRHLAVVLSASAGSKTIEVLFDIDPALPEVVIGDALRLQQVLINLGGNAIKFTTTGQVVIAINVLARTTDGVTVQFSVQDSGIGIAPEHQEHIFSGFSQAEASTTRRFGGTGLGLAICKRLVELMGGRIHIDSTPDVGSTFAFSITLPVAADDADPTNPKRLVNSAMKVNDQRHVLVVDDSPIAGPLLVRMLQSLGWRVDLANSGAQALNMVTASVQTHAESYGVVYMDWQMSGMDGWETTARVQQWCSARDIAPPPFVMLSAHGRENLSQRSPDEQAMLHGFLVKPVTAAMLREAAEDNADNRHGALRTAQGRSSQRQLRGMRILVVEDNLINQQVAEELLANEGALVSLACNGLLGFEAVRAAAPQFDVVLMDIQMPVLDGYGATRRIREELDFAGLPIITMTANAMPGDRETCLASGMSDHVGKPFDMAQLVSLLIRTTGFVSGHQDESEPNSGRVPSGVAKQVDLKPELKFVPPADLAVDLAIERMAGLTSLYVRSAREFSKSLATVIADLQPLLTTGNHSKARMLLHTLKGNAGTLGATALAQEAGKLEAWCAAAGESNRMALPLTVMESLIQSTARALNQTILMLDPRTPGRVEPSLALQTAPEPAAALDGQAVAALQELAGLLQVGDMAALQRLAELRVALQSLPQVSFDALDEALQNLDLDVALEVCVEALGSR